MISAGLIKWVEQGLKNKKNKTSSKYNQLSQLTIIIPSYCRQDYLLRQVVFWAFTDVTIIIADGSPEPFGSSLLELISDLHNICYKHSTDSYTSRIKESCKDIETPYAMCLADDDIFLKEGLCRTIDYLNKDNEIVACAGQLMGVDHDEENRRGYYFPYGNSLNSYQVVFDDPITRIRFAMDGYRTATSYAVYRTEAFKGVWQDIQTTSCLEATEYEHAVATYMLGSLSTVNDIYWLRSHECEPVDSVIDGTRATTFQVWWTEKEFKHECIAFVDRLTKKLSINSELDEKEAEKIINEAIDYILSGKHNSLMNQTTSLIVITRLLNFIKAMSFIDNWVRKLRSTALGMTIRRKIRSIIRGSKVQPVASDRTDLNEYTAKELENTLVLINGFHSSKI